MNTVIVFIALTSLTIWIMVASYLLADTTLKTGERPTSGDLARLIRLFVGLGVLVAVVHLILLREKSVCPLPILRPRSARGRLDHHVLGVAVVRSRFRIVDLVLGRNNLVLQQPRVAIHQDSAPDRRQLRKLGLRFPRLVW